MSNTEKKSKNIEMITGDPKKAIVKLALPMMLNAPPLGLNAPTFM